MTELWVSASTLISWLGGKVKSKKTILAVAKKENWEARKRKCKGGERYEFFISSLPLYLKKKISKKLMSPQVFEKFFCKTGGEIEKFKRFQQIIYLVCSFSGSSKKAVLKQLIMLVENNCVSEELSQFVLSLKKKKTKKIDFHFLYNFLKKESSQSKAISAVIKIEKAQYVLSPFLPYYQTFKNLSISAAYREYKTNQELKGLDFLSESQIRRLLKKLPDFIRERGRKTGQEMLSLRAYKRRHWEKSLVNTTWAGDGHALHCKIRHPVSGRAARPEITFIIDTTSRFCVGYSLEFAESSLAVIEALYRSMLRYGLPCSYYSDNGAGQTNSLLDDPHTGILAQLFIEHNLSIAGRPQSRGIIERPMRSLAKNIAIRMPTYFNEDADQNKIRKNLYYANSATKAFNEGKPLNKRQQKALADLPTEADLIQVIEEEIYKYNHKKHSSLNATPASVYEAGIEELKELDLYSFLVKEELDSYFKVSYVRSVKRGWITVNNNFYFAKELELYDKQKVICKLTINDGENIEVWELNRKKFICSAKYEGNSIDNKPKSYVELKVEERRKNRERLIKDKYQQITAESRNLIDLSAQENFFSILANAANDGNQTVLLKEQEKRDQLLNKLLGLEN